MPRKVIDRRNHSAPSRFVDESPEGTEFRRLAKRVLDLCKQSTPLTLMVTSAVRGEGKTTVATNLAIALASDKRRKVLLVDADLRRPRLHTLFGFTRRNGLGDVLRNDLKARTVYKNSTLENLMVITGGRFNKSPSKLFNNSRWREVLVELKADFDVIVFDFPPTIPVNEPEAVGKEMDAVLFVFLSGRTPREVGQRAVSILKSAQANLLGVIVNDLSEVLPYYYRQRYYKYYNTKPEVTFHSKKET